MWFSKYFYKNYYVILILSMHANFFTHYSRRELIINLKYLLVPIRKILVLLRPSENGHYLKWILKYMRFFWFMIYIWKIIGFIKYHKPNNRKKPVKRSISFIITKYFRTQNFSNRNIHSGKIFTNDRKQTRLKNSYF